MISNRHCVDHPNTDSNFHRLLISSLRRCARPLQGRTQLISLSDLRLRALCVSHIIEKSLTLEHSRAYNRICPASASAMSRYLPQHTMEKHRNPETLAKASPKTLYSRQHNSIVDRRRAESEKCTFRHMSASFRGRSGDQSSVTGDVALRWPGKLQRQVCAMNSLTCGVFVARMYGCPIGGKHGSEF